MFSQTYQLHIARECFKILTKKWKMLNLSQLLALKFDLFRLSYIYYNLSYYLSALFLSLALPPSLSGNLCVHFHTDVQNRENVLPTKSVWYVCVCVCVCVCVWVCECVCFLFVEGWASKRTKQVGERKRKTEVFLH